MKILICPKVSKYEWDLHKYRLSHNQLINKYKEEKADYENILNSHERQVKSRKLAQKIFPEAKFVEREHLTKVDIKNTDITISLGGDNHFQYVSHFIDKELMFGINSDPQTSEGVLLSCTTEHLENIRHKYENKDYMIEEWTRLDVFVNDRFFGRATCDVFIGESERKYTSRQIIEYRGEERQQKSSGILISTGSGSTGWYNSASRYNCKRNDDVSFLPTMKYAKFIVTEPYKGTLTDHSLISGIINYDTEIKIHSLNDNKGKVIIDSLDEFAFPRGYIATLKLSEFPLNILKFD